MTQSCGKWLKYVEKWLNYLTDDLKMWKVTEIWEMSKIFGKCLRYMGHGLSV